MDEKMIDSIQVVVCQDPEILAALYLKFKADGLLRTIWYDNPPDIVDHIQHFSSNKCISIVSLRNNTIWGIGWVYDIILLGNGLYRGTVGFGYSKEGSVHEKLHATRLMLDIVFDQYAIDFVHGYTPTKNPAAVGFAKRLGFKMHGPVPNYCSFHGEMDGVWVSSLSKDEWEKSRSRERNAAQCCDADTASAGSV